MNRNLYLVEYGDPGVKGGIRNIGNETVHLSAQIEFYDAKKRILTPDSLAWLSKREIEDVELEPRGYKGFDYSPGGIDPTAVRSYKIVVVPK